VGQEGGAKKAAAQKVATRKVAGKKPAPKRTAPRVRLIHWNADEAEAHAETLRRAGYEVEAGPIDGAGYRALRYHPPAAFVISLECLPSHGREIASGLRAAAGYEPVRVDSALAGYSGTPLPRKLGIRDGYRVELIGAPADFEQTLGALPPGVRLLRRGGGADLRSGSCRSTPSSSCGCARLPPRWVRVDCGSCGRRKRRARERAHRLQDLRGRCALVGTSLREEEGERMTSARKTSTPRAGGKRGGGAPSSHLFADAADEYARFRPGYPPVLFRELAAAAPARGIAWDCACGSGQASTGLAAEFARVIGTDLHLAPLLRAPRTPAIAYAAARAERSCLRGGSADCVVVAQALHWLDLDVFYPEVERVLAPGGVFAACCYALMEIDPAFNPLLAELYYELLAPWWTPERRAVDAGYSTLPFPFDEIALPPIMLRVRWTLDELLGHLGTWSSVRRARGEGVDPLALWIPRLRPLWGDSGRVREVRWPLAVRAGRRRTSASR
jgi:SAM-dependent methyltransferase